MTTQAPVAARFDQCESVIEYVDQPAFVRDRAGRLLRWNATAGEALGLDSAAREALSGPARERLAAFEQVLRCAGGPFMIVLPTVNGERSYSIDGAADAEAHGPILVLRDETELVAARRALADSEQRFGAIASTAMEAFVVLDPAGRVEFWNCAAERIFGWTSAEALGRELWTLANADALAELARDRSSAGSSHRLTARHRDGDPVEIEASFSPFRSGPRGRILVVLRDVTECAREHARLRESEQRWQHALESGGDAVWDLDTLTGQAIFGPRYKAMLGYREDEFDDNFEALFARIHPDDQPRVRNQLEEALRADQPGGYRCAFRMRARDGDYRWIEARGRVIERSPNGEPLRMVGTHRDVTDAREAEEALQRQLAETQRLNRRLEELNLQLFQSEKMASIGQLAAGVAHEMNSPLAFIGSNVGTLQKYVDKLYAAVDGCSRDGAAAEHLRATLGEDLEFLREDLPALFSETREGIDRVRLIVSDLKDFSRVGEQRWEYADLQRGLDSTLNILRNELKHKAEVLREYGELPEVWCIPSQLNQVFMNLLVNAAQAIPKFGTITIRTVATGDWVTVDIADTGAGMPPEVLKRIFEPFFTTKPVGTGTGLGLAIAFRIVSQHGGRIHAVSESGQGTCFSVSLPVGGPEVAALRGRDDAE